MQESSQVRRRSCHYSSSPLIHTTTTQPPPDHDSHGKENNLHYAQSLNPLRDNFIAEWVEQTTRFSVSSSCTDVSNTSSDSSYHSRDGDVDRGLFLTQPEREKIRIIYDSFRSDTWVGESLVNLYTSTRGGPWLLRYTGVPVLILDLGGSRSRGKGVRIILAERGSGLCLWSDVLDNLSAYEASSGHGHSSRQGDPLFHIFHCSRDHTVRVGLSWDGERTARHFFQRVERAMSRPENIGLSGPKQRPMRGSFVSLTAGSTGSLLEATRRRLPFSKTLPRRPKGPAVVLHSSSSLREHQPGGGAAARQPNRDYFAMSKTDISNPIGFKHNVSLNIDNLARHFSLSLTTENM